MHTQLEEVSRCDPVYLVPLVTAVPIICCTNQWTGFYMTWTSVRKELSIKQKPFVSA